jgi:hypothetical protein
VYTDPDALSVEIAWNFGDNTIVTGTLTPTHAYADDGVYTVTLTITDDLGAVGADSLLVTVSNVAPVIAPLADQEITVGDALTLTATFTDPGLLDTHTAVIVWGDGLSETLDLAGGVYSFEITHSYAMTGTYPVTVTLSDDDGGVDVASFDVHVGAVVVTTYTIWLPVINKPVMP